MNWIKVEPNPADNDAHPERLPPLDTVVAVIWLSNYDDSQVFALGGRVNDGDGWLWALSDLSELHRTSPVTELIADDDYRVTHWAEIQWPED